MYKIITRAPRRLMFNGPCLVTVRGQALMLHYQGPRVGGSSPHSRFLPTGFRALSHVSLSKYHVELIGLPNDCLDIREALPLDGLPPLLPGHDLVGHLTLDGPDLYGLTLTPLHDVVTQPTKELRIPLSDVVGGGDDLVRGDEPVLLIRTSH